MNIFSKIRKRYISAELPMRLNIFNMMSFIGIVGGVVSILTTHVMNISNSQVYPMLVAVVLLVLFLYMANTKHMLNLAAILLCSIIGFGVFPMMFINGGGIYSGMPIWFMLELVFTSILIEGKPKYVIGVIALTVYTGLIYFAYAFPDRLTYFSSDEMIFMDFGQSAVFVGLCIMFIISFQVNMYDREFKRAEDAAKEAEKAKEAAFAASEAKSSFLANMSHEIRTPIGVIVGMNEMIQRESNQQAILDYSDDISSSAKTLLSIINDILDFSKIESGKMSIFEEEYSLESVINDIQEVAKIKKEETGLTFVTNVDYQLPRKLKGDDLRIKQCILNILTNAFKYTEKGSITFKVSGERDGDNAKITFSISDTGQGIREEDKEKLFESFVRLDESQNRSIQGTGLGLNITNRLLNLMGSNLEVESTYQKGSRFYFTISQKIVDETPISDESDTGEENQKEGYTPSLIAPNAKALVVDDSKINLKVFCSLIRQTQIQTDTATSGYDAIDMIRNNHYDIIFLDHMMPGMDGEETFIKLKEEKLIGDTPVVMLTANAIFGMKEHFLEVGFNEYLSKPIEFRKLEAILSKYLL